MYVLPEVTFIQIMRCTFMNVSYFCCLMRKVFFLFLAAGIVFASGSCNSTYKKLLKSKDMNAKMVAADNYYAKKDFAHALQLYEQLSDRKSVV